MVFRIALSISLFWVLGKRDLHIHSSQLPAISCVSHPQVSRLSLLTKVADGFLISTVCKVTGRRHRASPCRSACFASPWWLLTLSLVDAVEKQLYYSQSRDGIWRCGSRPSLFYDNPEYKRHSNYTKTDQLPISEAITGLPRPYHHTSPPWWVAYAELWEIRGNPSSPN